MTGHGKRIWLIDGSAVNAGQLVKKSATFWQYNAG